MYKYLIDPKRVYRIVGYKENKIVYVINKDGNFYGDFISSKYEVRPAFYLKGDASIIDGKGTKDEPYVLGVDNES